MVYKLLLLFSLTFCRDSSKTVNVDWQRVFLRFELLIKWIYYFFLSLSVKLLIRWFVSVQKGAVYQLSASKYHEKDASYFKNMIG